MKGEPVQPRCLARETAVPCLVHVACAVRRWLCPVGTNGHGRVEAVGAPSAARSSGRSSGLGQMAASVRRREFRARPYVSSLRCASWPRAPLTSLPSETAARVVRAEALQARAARSSAAACRSSHSPTYSVHLPSSSISARASRNLLCCLRPSSFASLIAVMRRLHMARSLAARSRLRPCRALRPKIRRQPTRSQNVCSSRQRAADKQPPVKPTGLEVSSTKLRPASLHS